MFKVAINKINYDAPNLQDEVILRVKESMENTGINTVINKNDIIFIKPNFCCDFVFPGYTTSPWVVEGVINCIKDKVREIWIVESDTWTTSADKAFKVLGYEYLLSKYNVKWINLSKSKFTKIAVPDAKGLDAVMLVPEIILTGKIITVPVLKTHGNSVYSGAIKNQWGILPKIRLGYHEKIDFALADLNKILKPVFCVIDGTIRQDGKGPKQGNVYLSNFVSSSIDNVSIDSAMVDLMQIPKDKVAHIQYAMEAKTGDINYELIGNKLDMPQSIFGQRALLTKADLFLRKPILKYLFYDTALFNILLIGARLNYFFWMMFIGNKRKNEMLKSRYGTQWKN